MITKFFGIPFLKKGSGIHIKKENRGLFTDYCGGKVTNECILRGKNSSDPKIRKRATFALNARSWSKKHLIGGLIEYKGPTYSEVLELWAKEDPLSYNTKQIKTGIRQGDFINYTDAEGKQLRIPAAIGMSGTDPVGSFVVETVASTKPLQLVGKGIQYGLANLPKILLMITHPTWLKIYHGSNRKFTWKEAKPYSRANVGLHVSPNKKVAESFTTKEGVLLEGYAPKPKVETIDIWSNNYNLLNTEYRFLAMPKEGLSSYNIVLPDTKRLNLLQKAGAKPSLTLKYENPITGKIYKLNTENPVNLNLRKELKLSKSANKKADDIMNRSLKMFDNKDEILNKETTELLSKDGIKTIKYNNNSIVEGGGGESWILTDPSMVWNPTWKPVYINPRLEMLSPIVPLTHD